MNHHTTTQEQLLQATYLEDYLDTIESLPNDLQRNVSQMREIDSLYQNVLREIATIHEHLKKNIDGSVRKKHVIQLQRALVRSQELGDEKLQLVSHMVDLVENRTRQLQVDWDSLENENGHHEQKPPPLHPAQPPMIVEAPPHKAAAESHSDKSSAKRPRRQRHHHHHGTSEHHGRKEESLAVDKDLASSTTSSNDKPKKKKRSKSKQDRNNSPMPPDIIIDPNEPTYCLCNQVSYGEMIGCDNDACELEWFHFNCVGLTSKPKGKWYCPKCAPEFKDRKKHR